MIFSLQRLKNCQMETKDYFYDAETWRQAPLVSGSWFCFPTLCWLCHGLLRYQNGMEPSLLLLCFSRCDQTCLLWNRWLLPPKDAFCSKCQMIKSQLAVSEKNTLLLHHHSYIMGTCRTVGHSAGSTKHSVSLITSGFTTIIFTSVKCILLHRGIVGRQTCDGLLQCYMVKLFKALLKTL